MTSRQEISHALAQIPDKIFRDACMRLASALCDRSSDKAIMWSYKSLSTLLGVAPHDPLLQRCIEVLVSRPSVKLLEMHFLYFSPGDDGSPGEILNDDEVSAAYQRGFLVDPVTGDEITEFEKTLVPYFQIRQDVNGRGTDH